MIILLFVNTVCAMKVLIFFPPILVNITYLKFQSFALVGQFFIIFF